MLPPLKSDLLGRTTTNLSNPPPPTCMEELQLENQELRLILSSLREDLFSLRTAMDEERRKRQSLEIRHRRLALGLYRVAAAQESGAKALRTLMDGQCDSVRKVCEEVEKWKPEMRNGKIRFRVKANNADAAQVDELMKMS